MLYYRIQPSINDIYDIAEGPNLPDDISFLAGRFISDRLPASLEFVLDHPKDERPRHLLGNVIPVASHLFLETLSAAGADNFQAFPALLRQPSSGDQYAAYSAFNIVGLIDAVDKASSSHDVIMPGGDDGVPPLVDFRELVFLKSKTKNLSMFRLVQDPMGMFLIDRVMDYLVSRKPDGGWGITTFEVPVR